MRWGRLFVEVDADFVIEPDPWSHALRSTDLILIDYFRVLALGHFERKVDWLVEDTWQFCDTPSRVVRDMMLDQSGSFQVDEAKGRWVCRSLVWGGSEQGAKSLCWILSSQELKVSFSLGIRNPWKIAAIFRGYLNILMILLFRITLRQFCSSTAVLSELRLGVTGAILPLGHVTDWRHLPYHLLLTLLMLWYLCHHDLFGLSFGTSEDELELLWGPFSAAHWAFFGLRPRMTALVRRIQLLEYLS